MFPDSHLFTFYPLVIHASTYYLGRQGLAAKSTYRHCICRLGPNLDASGYKAGVCLNSAPKAGSEAGSEADSDILAC